MSVALLDNGASGQVEQTGSPDIQPTKPARYTGEILLRTRPKTYRKVVDLLSQGESALYISKECRVSRMTIDAISERQAESISQRKQELTNMMTDIAYIGGARVMDTISKAGTRDASIGMGVAVDKALALLGQSPAVQVANIIMPSEADRAERRQLHDKLDAITARLNAQQ